MKGFYSILHSPKENRIWIDHIIVNTCDKKTAAHVICKFWQHEKTHSGGKRVKSGKTLFGINIQG